MKLKISIAAALLVTLGAAAAQSQTNVIGLHEAKTPVILLNVGAPLKATPANKAVDFVAMDVKHQVGQGYIMRAYLTPGEMPSATYLFEAKNGGGSICIKHGGGCGGYPLDVPKVTDLATSKPKQLQVAMKASIGAGIIEAHAGNDKAKNGSSDTVAGTGTQFGIGIIHRGRLPIVLS